MKRFLIVFLFFSFFINQSNSQHCDIDPWIEANYYNDARLLVFEDIIADTLHPFRDSVAFPKNKVDEYLGMISSVYNLHNSSSDSIFNTFQIHKIPHEVYPNEITVGISGSSQWAAYLQFGMFPTGNNEFDSIINLFNIDIRYRYHYLGNRIYDFTSEDYFNAFALCKLLLTIDDISEAEVKYYAIPLCAGYTTDGISSISNGISFGYVANDCDMNTYRKAWDFNIDSNCTAMLENVYTDVQHLSVHQFNIYPNPTHNYLNITTTLPTNQPLHYQIINTLGEAVMKNNSNEKTFSADVQTLPSGVYFIRLQSGNESVVKRFVRE